MPQQTVADVTLEPYRKPTRRKRFLEEMHRVVLWAELVAVIAPVYPKAGWPAVHQWGLSTWYDCIGCKRGLPCRTRRLKRCCTTRAPCGSLWGLIWTASQRPMRR
jgi:hypothetical protein